MVNFGKLLFFVMMTVCFSVHVHADDAFVGKISPIPDDIQKQMTGKTWKADCPVPLDELAYLQLSHIGFDGEHHVGELIVNKAIAEDAVATFKDLYEARYQIESMKLPSSFAMQNDSQEKNNSSAFACRIDAQTPSNLSLHSYGIAVDLNPFYNPSPVADGKVEPEGAEMYLDRTLQHKAMIHEGDQVFLVMARYGWAWGGFFKKGKDPMHFEKIMTRQYIIKSLEYHPNDIGIDSAL